MRGFRRLQWWVREVPGPSVAAIGAALWGCTPAPAAKAPAPKVAEPETPAVQAEPAQPAPPAEPPDLHLELLEERLALGLAIQNRTTEPQRLSPELRLAGQGGAVDLSLADGSACLVLRPGAEWLWPADWGRTLAPDQAALAGLEGPHHFEVTGCDGGEPLRSPEVSLPLRYR